MNKFKAERFATTAMEMEMLTRAPTLSDMAEALQAVTRYSV
jgi:hypothetical protein